jgi:hypothetical protein
VLEEKGEKVMRSKLFGSGALALVAMLVVSMMAVLPVYAQTTVEVRDPTDTTNVFSFNTATTAVGDTFDVVVWVKGVSDLFGWQLNFTWDPSQLSIVSASIPSTDPDYVFYASTGPRMPLGPTYQVNNVVIGESLLTDPANFPFTGDGKLAVITLQIIAPPPKMGSLSSVLDVDTVGTMTTKLKDSTGAAIAFTDVDGTYTYTWSEPATRPYFTVVPLETRLGPYPPSVIGTWFTVDIVIAQLDPAWGLTDADMQIEFNSTLIDFGTPGVIWNPLWATTSFTTDYTGALANIILNVSDPTATPSGDVLVATLNFTVLYQGLYPDVDTSPLNFVDEQCVLYDAPGPAIIPQAKPPEDGIVIIEGLMVLAPPWLEVEPSDIILGPDLVVGEQFIKRFTVNVNIVELDIHWYMVGVMFRLTYDQDLVKVVAWEEGPFLPSFPNAEAPPYTFPIFYPNEKFPVCHFLFGDLLLPNATAMAEGKPGWTNFPYTDPGEPGTLLTITFEPLVQSWVDTYSFELGLFDIKLTGLKDPTDPASPLVHIPTQPSINGTVTILPIAPVGRRIDVWMQYPAPYGGQGLGEPADLVVPQQEICLTAKVTYNWWPVEGKRVTFEIRDNNNNLVAILSAITGADGHAYTCFRMPWPGENLFGVWTVIASVEVADQVVTDTMSFHYDYLVQIWSVSTDKLEYAHLETVEITVEYGTHAQQSYQVWLYAVLQDELGVPVGIASIGKTVGGAAYSSYKNYTDTVSITIPHSAYAGLATIRVNIIDEWPSAGGSAVTPEATKDIWILPL